ncbi:hypothetical protein DY000_02030024 [Brassica cretica]|uniref:Transposase-associated domain-containing protein n=1 Tax=Brassica cretica TaxID=69181 RepID=A0ABQ7DN57_BRACR|nr:hypothetical protein DY000_02030024 [Brassica cretica]
MSSSNYFRSWIDRPHLDPNTRLLTEEYQRGITEFMGLVHRQPEAKTGMLRCPCSNCKNRKKQRKKLKALPLHVHGWKPSFEAPVAEKTLYVDTVHSVDKKVQEESMEQSLLTEEVQNLIGPGEVQLRDGDALKRRPDMDTDKI